MQIDVGSFKGEAPRVSPRLLPNQMGQNSSNARLISGNLESWYDFNYSAPAAGYSTLTTPLPVLPGTGGTIALLHFDGTAGATTFTDVMGNVWSPVGTAQIATATPTPKFGVGELKLTAPTDWITSPGGPTTPFYSLLLGDFTFECWVYPTANSANSIFGKRTSGAGTPGEFGFNISSSGAGSVLQFTAFDSNGNTRCGIIGVGAVSQNAWSHVACVKQGGTFTLYLNGVQVGQQTGVIPSGWAWPTLNIPISVGNIQYDFGNGAFSGFIDEVRISNYAVYTSNFSVPTAAFTVPTYSYSQVLAPQGTQTIYFLNDQAWLTWTTAPSTPTYGITNKLWETAIATPFYDGSQGAINQNTSLFAKVTSIAGPIRIVDYKTYQTWNGAHTGPPGTNPGQAVGDGLTYLVSTANGTLIGSTSNSPAESALWGSRWGNAPGGGGTLISGHLLYPYGYSVVMSLSNGNYVFCPMGTLTGNLIVGGVSDPTLANPCLIVFNPVTNTVVYDIIPAIAGIMASMTQVFPCADGAHLFIMGSVSGTSSYDKWAIVAIGSSSATLVSSGTWTHGSLNLAWQQYGVGASLQVENSTGANSTAGMLESNLGQLWILYDNTTVRFQFGIYALINSAASKVVYEGVAFANAGPLALPYNVSESIFADGGLAVFTAGNYISFWSSPLNLLTQLFEVATTSPSWATNSNYNATSPAFMWPIITGISSTGITVVGRKIYSNVNLADVQGDGIAYTYSVLSGGLASTAPENANQLLWPSRSQYFGSRSMTGGGSLTQTPTYGGWATADGYSLAVGYGAISGGASVNGNGEIILISNYWTTPTFALDVVPALVGVSATTYLKAVLPCADLIHALVITTDTFSAPYVYNVLKITGSGAVSVSHGAFSTSVFNSVFGNWSPGSSDAMDAALDNTSEPKGVLQSDLVTFWVECTGAGGSVSLAVCQLGGTNGAVTLASVTNFAPAHVGLSGPAAIWADNGTCAIIKNNVLTVWQLPQPSGVYVTGSEVDVAKMALAGDTSVRTIFCGTDAPRFTDLGLATGLVTGSTPVTGSSTLGAASPPYPTYSRKLGVPNPAASGSWYDAVVNPAGTLSPITAVAGSGSTTAYTAPTETFQNPVNWNIITVPGTSAQAFLLTGGNPGACLYLTSIGAPAQANKSFTVDPTQPVTMGIDFAVMRLLNAYQQQGYLSFDFGMDGSGNGSQVRVITTPTGVTIQFGVLQSHAFYSLVGQFVIASGSIPTWYVDGADPSHWNGPFHPNTFYTASLVITPTAGTSNASVVFTIKSGSTVVMTATQAGCPIAGSYFGVESYMPGGQPIPYYYSIYFDNMTISGTTSVLPTVAGSRVYVYTIVNDIGEESGPSLASNTLTLNVGQAVSVPLPQSLAQTGADVSFFKVGNATMPATINLYRSVTASNGQTSFLLVASNLAFSATPFLDQIQDSALSLALASTLWYPPPSNMIGILALPNQIYAGFTPTQLCLSEQGIPHAWPVANRLTFDYPIVAIGNIDSMVIVATTAFPYVCAGNVPSAFSQTKASYPHACASKKSLAYLKGVGVVYATFEGLVAISGPGHETLLTEHLFSLKEWKALNPASMIAAVNDGRYFCWYTTLQGTQGGFYLDIAEQGSGKISLNWHASVRYQDPLSDTLYTVLDVNPTGENWGSYIVGFNSNTAVLMPYVWKSKQFYIDHETTFRMARVSANSYNNTVLTLFSDGVQYAQYTVTSEKEFAIAAPPTGTTRVYFEFQLAGTDSINRVQIVEDAGDFT